MPTVAAKVPEVADELASKAPEVAEPSEGPTTNLCAVLCARCVQAPSGHPWSAPAALLNALARRAGYPKGFPPLVQAVLCLSTFLAVAVPVGMWYVSDVFLPMSDPMVWHPIFMTLGFALMSKGLLFNHRDHLKAHVACMAAAAACYALGYAAMFYKHETVGASQFGRPALQNKAHVYLGYIAIAGMAAQASTGVNKYVKLPARVLHGVHLYGQHAVYATSALSLLLAPHLIPVWSMPYVLLLNVSAAALYVCTMQVPKMWHRDAPLAASAAPAPSPPSAFDRPTVISPGSAPPVVTAA